MKKGLILASMLMLSSTVLVADSAKEWFIGGEFGGTNVNVNVKVSELTTGTNNSEDVSYKPTYEAFKFGKYYKTGRLYGFYAHQNKKDETTADTIGIGYDYLFKNFGKVVPFVGAQAMYTKVKFGFENDNDRKKSNEINSRKGFGYGIGVGVIYPVTESVEVEAGIRYVKTDIEYSETYTNGNSAKIEIEDFTQYYLGVNYKF